MFSEAVRRMFGREPVHLPVVVAPSQHGGGWNVLTRSRDDAPWTVYGYYLTKAAAMRDARTVAGLPPRGRLDGVKVRGTPAGA